jgi:hypothetical protein
VKSGEIAETVQHGIRCREKNDSSSNARNPVLPLFSTLLKPFPSPQLNEQEERIQAERRKMYLEARLYCPQGPL